MIVTNLTARQPSRFLARAEDHFVALVGFKPDRQPDKGFNARHQRSKGGDAQRAGGAIRFSAGIDPTQADDDRAASLVVDAWMRYRRA